MERIVAMGHFWVVRPIQCFTPLSFSSLLRICRPKMTRGIFVWLKYKGFVCWLSTFKKSFDVISHPMAVSSCQSRCCILVFYILISQISKSIQIISKITKNVNQYLFYCVSRTSFQSNRVPRNSKSNKFTKVRITKRRRIRCFHTRNHKMLDNFALLLQRC